MKNAAVAGQYQPNQIFIAGAAIWLVDCKRKAYAEGGCLH
jgi:hypothetical protein